MEKFKTVSLKNNQQVRICLLVPNKNSNNYMVLAIKDKKQIGYCYFNIINNNCNIERIAVTNSQYLSTGLGSAMFNMMEQVALNVGVGYICGRFIARGYRDVHQITSNFYKKHGFIPEDDNEFLDREELVKRVEKSKSNAELPIVVNYGLYNALMHYNYSENDIFSSGEKSVTKEPQCDL